MILSPHTVALCACHERSNASDLIVSIMLLSCLGNKCVNYEHTYLDTVTAAVWGLKVIVCMLTPIVFFFAVLFKVRQLVVYSVGLDQDFTCTFSRFSLLPSFNCVSLIYCCSSSSPFKERETLMGWKKERGEKNVTWTIGQLPGRFCFNLRSVRDVVKLWWFSSQQCGVTHVCILCCPLIGVRNHKWAEI